MSALAVLGLIAVSSQESCAKPLVDLLIGAIDGQELMLAAGGKELDARQLAYLRWQFEHGILTGHPKAEHFRREIGHLIQTDQEAWWILTQIRAGGDSRSWAKIEQWGVANLPQGD